MTFKIEDLPKVHEKLELLRIASVDQVMLQGLWNAQNGNYSPTELSTYRYLRQNLLTDSTSLLDVMLDAATIQAYTFREKPCVLIHGETGTGKETFARSFAQPELPFVGINCTALPEYLLESELFGHVQGAFTGAINNRNGLFHTAGYGVLFLDEIGDMPPTLQPKLLRVLQERSYRPVGANAELPIKCRVVCATHRPAEYFRQDLYNRLAQYTLTIPPLRDRPDDAWLYLQSRYPNVKFVLSEVNQVIIKGNYRELDAYARSVQLKMWRENVKAMPPNGLA